MRRMKISEKENLIVVGVATIHIGKLRIKKSCRFSLSSTEVQERNITRGCRNEGQALALRKSWFLNQGWMSYF